MPIYLIDKVKPKGGGGFPMVDAEDVDVDGVRLTDYLPQKVTQAEYNALEKAGELIPTKLYAIPEE